MIASIQRQWYSHPLGMQLQTLSTILFVRGGNPIPRLVRTPRAEQVVRPALPTMLLGE